jgi:uncharacterized repeat protein (TIGR01451 family)
MNIPAARQSRIRVKCFTALMLLTFAVAVLAVPMISVNSRSVSSEAPDATRNRTAQQIITHKKSWILNWASMAFAGETVELFAADCATPKTDFNLGETVCAKTDGVDLTVPGNHYMNWVDSQLNQTNGGTITQNPQYFLYVPPAADSYKATIGRVTPPDSSIIGNPPIFTVTQTPGISTFNATCTTPKTTFVLGETVCATAAATGGSAARRRVVWIDPSGNARQVDAITTDPESFSFSIPLTQTSIVGDQTVDNRGKWKVNIISLRGSVVATTTFVVTDPVNPSADLSAVKFSEGATVSAGSNTTFFISVFNNGPDAAVNAVLDDPLPGNTTFFSITQTSGPTFTCTSPNIGSAGTVNCTIASLPRDSNAQFELTVQVSSGAAANSVITNTATVSSDTDDENADNDSASASITVTGGGGGNGTCTLGCPDDITTPANTNQGGPGAIVHFSPPSGNEECGNITVDHCNDCFFPQGDTTVTATAESGESCTFTVTVTAAGSSPTISCPGNKTADADANVCSTSVNVGTATASGSNVTVVGYRSDGVPMYTCDKFGNCTRNASDGPFNAGTTTITWYAYAHDVAGPYTGPVDGDGDPINPADTEEGHRTGSATCSQTVMVNDVTPPNIAAASSTVSADENCEAVIPDYSSTVTDNCACGSADDSEACEGHPHIVYTQTPAAGTVVGLGPHTVHIEATDGSSNNNGATKDVTFTVNDTTAPVIDCPDNISNVPTEPGTCAAHVDPGTATANDNCDSSPTITASRSDNRPLTDTYPKGTTTITWTATDDAGNQSSCTQTITVVDNEPPVIVFNGQTPSMWPPNHKYQTFGVTNFVTSVTDNCDSISVSSVYITKVTSDEIENGNGDGNTVNDIVIAADCKSVQLRSEREGNGNGRVYTLFFKVVDSSGNVGTGTATVVVKHNPGETAVDSGPHYTVTSNCP